jgi:hypothetical protein
MKYILVRYTSGIVDIDKFLDKCGQSRDAVLSPLSYWSRAKLVIVQLVL